MCAQMGVDFIGLNFAPESKRYLDLKTARALVRDVRANFPTMSFVGVFVNELPAAIETMVRDLNLAAVQLHGEETEAEAQALRETAPVIKAFRVNSAAKADTIVGYPCDSVLLDTWDPTHRGGTGEAFDWKFAAALRPRIRRLVLAGGLNAENVAAAICLVQPSAVDVCSGVEDSPGGKSPEKLRRFLQAIR